MFRVIFDTNRIFITDGNIVIDCGIDFKYVPGKYPPISCSSGFWLVSWVVLIYSSKLWSLQAVSVSELIRFCHQTPPPTHHSQDCIMSHHTHSHTHSYQALRLYLTWQLPYSPWPQRQTPVSAALFRSSGWTLFLRFHFRTSSESLPLLSTD